MIKNRENAILLLKKNKISEKDFDSWLTVQEALWLYERDQYFKSEKNRKEHICTISCPPDCRW